MQRQKAKTQSGPNHGNPSSENLCGLGSERLPSPIQEDLGSRGFERLPNLIPFVTDPNSENLGRRAFERPPKTKLTNRGSFC